MLLASMLIPLAAAVPLTWEKVRGDTLSQMPQLLAADSRISAARAKLRASEGASPTSLWSKAPSNWWARPADSSSTLITIVSGS